MKPFVLQPKMLTMGGVFYPTGYMFVMFPTRRKRETQSLRSRTRAIPANTFHSSPRGISRKRSHER